MQVQAASLQHLATMVPKDWIGSAMTARETVLSKVRKLIALTSSPYQEEARSAAYKATALIREFQLDVVDPTVTTKKPTEDWMLILSRYDGRCMTCQKKFKVGAYIHWKRGVGCIHEGCRKP